MKSELHPRRFVGNLTAGSIVTILLIPQGMAYAMLAGVSPILGLYAALVPMLVYLLFGSSAHLSVGPVSIVSVMTLSCLTGLSPHGTGSYLQILFVLGCSIGILLCLLGLLRVGRYCEHLPPAVLMGFTAAAAIIIGSYQIESLFKLDMPSEVKPIAWGLELVNRLPSADFDTVLLGAFSLASLYVMKKWTSVAIGPLFVVVVTIAGVNLFALDQRGVMTIGEVPRGFPSFAFFIPSMELVASVFPYALAIALILFLESYAVAKTIANQAGYRLNPDRELVGLGLANLASAFTGAIPVAGAFSRTAVNYRSGASSKTASLITLLLLTIILLFFTPLLRDLPEAALAAIILFAVAGLIDLKAIAAICRSSWIDAVLLLSTFLASLAFDVLYGLLTGIGLSALIHAVSAKRRPKLE